MSTTIFNFLNLFSSALPAHAILRGEMPKPDGSLYWYEKEKEAKKAAEAEGKLKPPSTNKKKAKGVAKARELSNPVASTDAKGNLAQADSNVVSIESGEPIRKRMGPKPGHSNHPLQPAKGKAGRPTVRVKATPEMIAGICADIKLGLSIESSCILHGVQRSGIDRWRKLNPSVNAQFEKAEVDFERDILGRINKSAIDDIKAQTWLLERRHPHRWAQTTKAELTGANGGPVQQLTIAKTLIGSLGVKSEPKRVSPAPIEVAS